MLASMTGNGNTSLSAVGFAWDDCVLRHGAQFVIVQQDKRSFTADERHRLPDAVAGDVRVRWGIGGRVTTAAVACKLASNVALRARFFRKWC